MLAWESFPSVPLNIIIVFIIIVSEVVRKLQREEKISGGHTAASLLQRYRISRQHLLHWLSLCNANTVSKASERSLRLLKKINYFRSSSIRQLCIISIQASHPVFIKDKLRVWMLFVRFLSVCSTEMHRATWAETRCHSFSIVHPLLQRWIFLKHHPCKLNTPSAFRLLQTLKSTSCFCPVKLHDVTERA